MNATHLLSAVVTELTLQPPRYPLPTGSSSLIRHMRRPLQTPALLSLLVSGQQDHAKRPTCTDSFIGRESIPRGSRPPAPTPRGFPFACPPPRRRLFVSVHHRVWSPVP